MGEGVRAARPTLRERQRDRTRADLVQAAIDAISEHGLEQATVDRIIGFAGVSRATVYAHFPLGRAELIDAAYQMIGEQLIARSEALAAEEESWIERVCAYLRAILELGGRPQLSAFYNVTGPRSAGLGKRRGSGSQRTFEIFRAELGDAQGRGEILPEVDVEAVAALLVGAVREAGIDSTRDPALATRLPAGFRSLLEALATRR